jgi:hypothetical protein
VLTKSILDAATKPSAVPEATIFSWQMFFLVPLNSKLGKFTFHCCGGNNIIKRFTKDRIVTYV